MQLPHPTRHISLPRRRPPEPGNGARDLHHGWWAHRLRRRLSFGYLRYAMRRDGLVPCSIASGVAGRFWTGFWEANPAGRAGCALRRRAIPAHGVNRRSWAAADGTRIQMLADGDAVLVIDETGFFEQGEASCGVARQYTGLGGKNHLPDRRVRLLCIVHGHASSTGGFICQKRGRTIPNAWRRHMRPRCLVCHETPIARATAAKIRNRAPVSFVMVRGRSNRSYCRDSDASPARSAGPARDRHLNCARTGYWMLGARSALRTLWRSLAEATWNVAAAINATPRRVSMSFAWSVLLCDAFLRERNVSR